MTATPATIHVRFTMEGFHYWPDAPDHRNYLAFEHRHLFCVEVSTQVDHDDREIEFHDLRDEAIVAFKANYTNAIAKVLGALSCEMIARNMGAALADKHARAFTVQVWEDGECGASVTAEAP